ncbi:tetratricopeptide repeat protein [Anabaena azotica]|uniref:Tetratricopeptide repeat protein n=1 Tax=Anabaena azotica FACHB-119 TaxID=947527 RepID=A0ABR8D4X7_9NOST|nr:tetratricopeptide repeat protein [Anabaena azotica]MBD2501521.1 hypothetical protein [Anabaena azotica FACHB-119]
MPSTLHIGLFVLGAVLVIIGFVGGNFKLFGAEFSSTVSNPFLRFSAIALGIFLIILAIGLNEPVPTTQQPPVQDPQLIADEWFNEGKKLENEGKCQEAIKAFRKAIKSIDASQEFCLMCTYKHKGDCEFKLNQIDEGIASYNLAAQTARKAGRENDAQWFENEIKNRKK